KWCGEERAEQSEPLSVAGVCDPDPAAQRPATEDSSPVCLRVRVVKYHRAKRFPHARDFRVTDLRGTADYAPPRALAAYLLGCLQFEALLALQRRLVYDVTGDRDTAALVLCEHQPGITIGRAGSYSHPRRTANAMNSH